MRLVCMCAMVASLVGCGMMVSADRAMPEPSGRKGVTNLVHVAGDGRLAYSPYDREGDVLPDFSVCGYEGGGVALPTVEAKVTLTPERGESDDGPRIQAAIDQVGKMGMGKDGYRGAVRLKKGVYRVAGTLKMNVSGVVLRGEGDGEDGTVLMATAAKQHDLIHVAGSGEMQMAAGTGRDITDAYVPVGARTIHVKEAGVFKKGDTVLVVRPSTEKWIHFIKMDQIGGGHPRPGTRQWEPGGYDLHFDRVVSKVEGDAVTLDAPMVNPLQQQFGTSRIVKYAFKGRVEHVGIEKLRGDSTYTSPTDEEHGWNLVTIAGAQNCFVRNVTARHFGYSCVTIGHGAKWCTVQDSKCIDAISKITGGRRYSFGIQGGTLSLVQRCYARDGRHDYVLGSRTTGPNAFVNCVAEKTHADIGPHHRWSCGCLFDNVYSTGQVDVEDRQAAGSGHGWAGAQMVFWNCRAGTMICQSPPTAQNFAIGCVVGKLEKGHWAPEHPNGWIESLGMPVAPKSLYAAQLKARLGEGAVRNVARVE
ncbi:MAG: hypothetical protein ACTHN5_01965 [Phycisphaerae bacterium]